jgi:hypothetical protein
MLLSNYMPNLRYMTPPVQAHKPLLCLFCGDDELAQVRNLQGQPVHYPATGEWLYVCGTCSEEFWA